MTYQDAIKSISNRLIFGSRPGLSQIQAILKAIGNPEKRLKFVHVAGTNGKGTTSTYIASVLKAAGYRTGLYTSPYVVNFRERFRINGEMIEERALAEQVEILEKQELAKELTEFAYITALAFNWFLVEKCDIVVLEVGLGGRFDATNVIESPLVSVITSISLDHTEFLGDTNEKIAFEKAGIIKTGTTCVLYPKQPKGVFQVIEQACVEHGARLVPVNTKIEIISESLNGTTAKLDDIELKIPFSGEHQVLNSSTALTAIGVLKEKGYIIDDSAIKTGFSESRIAARMELISQDPLIILDGGHNPGCAEALKALIEKHLKNITICGIMGMMKDKDSHSYLAAVGPLFSKIITVELNNPRAMKAHELQEEAMKFCKNAVATKSMKNAVEMALTSNCQAVIICGSLYLAGDIRETAINIANNWN